MLDKLLSRVLLSSKPKVRRSSEWTSVRVQHLKSAEPMCKACGTKKHLEVHHIVPVHVNPLIEIVPENLITLCESMGHNCHFIFGHLLDWRSWNVSVREDSDAYRHLVRGRPYKIGSDVYGKFS